MTINTNALASSMMPGVNKFYGVMYNRYPDQFSQIFDIYQSMKNYERDVNVNGLGHAMVVDEGSNVKMDVFKQAFIKTYQHLTVGLGFMITRNAIDDNLYPEQIQKFAERLAISMKATKELFAANVLNRAFSNSYVGADGIELCSTAHVKSKGGTYANKPAVDVDLSEKAVEDLLTLIGKFTDDAGINIQARGVKLIVPVELEWDARRILDSALQNDTANNALNVIRSSGALPGGLVVNNRLSDPNAYFIKTDVPDGLKHFIRRPLEITNDTAFLSENMQFKATERYSFGWTDPKGIVGSSGA